MTLCESVKQAMLIDDPTLQARALERIINANYGLHVQIAKSANKLYRGFLADHSECLGYMWQALPILLVEWDESKGMASTCWRKITLRLIRNEVTRNTTIASVRVPERAIGRYKAESSECSEAINTINAHEYLKRSYRKQTY